MKTTSTFRSIGPCRALALGAGLFTATLVTAAADARFFRVGGPVPTGITEFRPDGTLVWTNAPTYTTFTVQTAIALPGGTNWVNYVQVPTTNRVIDYYPPAGMVLIPCRELHDGGQPGRHRPSPTLRVCFGILHGRYKVTKALWDSVYSWAIAHD